jgi:hypothetical protein
MSVHALRPRMRRNGPRDAFAPPEAMSAPPGATCIAAALSCECKQSKLYASVWARQFIIYRLLTRSARIRRTVVFLFRPPLPASQSQHPVHITLPPKSVSSWQALGLCTFVDKCRPQGSLPASGCSCFAHVVINEDAGRANACVRAQPRRGASARRPP